MHDCSTDAEKAAAGAAAAAATHHKQASQTTTNKESPAVRAMATCVKTQVQEIA